MNTLKFNLLQKKRCLKNVPTVLLENVSYEECWNFIVNYENLFVYTRDSNGRFCRKYSNVASDGIGQNITSFLFGEFSYNNDKGVVYEIVNS